MKEGVSMLQQYWAPIFLSVGSSILIALIMAIPYAIYNYRKYGIVPMKRTFVWYSFMWYLVAAYFLVILPFPSREAVSEMTTPYYNLEPFIFVEHFLLNSGIDWADPSTYMRALIHPTAYTVYLNVIMMIPLGIFLRRYFYFGFFRTVASGFLLSLFFELTQLSGLYGIYSRPYRIFNVDDLMMNTFGVSIGFFVVPLINRYLPKIEESLADPEEEKVTIVRRMIAFVLDLLSIGIISIGLMRVLPLVPDLKDVLENHHSAIVFVITGLYFILSGWITGGYTIGMAIVKIKIANRKNREPGFLRLALRHLLFLLWFRGVWVIIDYLPVVRPVDLVINLFFVGLAMLGYLHIVYSLITAKECFFHEKLSNTKLITTNRTTKSIDR